MSSYGQDPEDGLRAQRAPVFVTLPIVPYWFIAFPCLSTIMCLWHWKPGQAQFQILKMTLLPNIL